MPVTKHRGLVVNKYKRPKRLVLLIWSTQIHWALCSFFVLFYFQFKILYKLA